MADEEREQIISTTPTPAVEATMLKIRKGSVAMLKPKDLEGVLHFLEGWKMEPARFILPTDDNRVVEELIGKTRHFLASSMYAPKEEGRTLKMWVTMYDYDPEVKATHDAARAKILAAQVDTIPEATPKSKLGQVYITDVTPVMADDEKGKTIYGFNVYTTVKGFRVTAPNGQSYELTMSDALGYGQGKHGMTEFYAWAKEHTNFVPEILAVLKMEPHYTAEQRKEMRGLLPGEDNDNLGHCTCCERGIKVNPETLEIVHHGYVRPGDGQIHGDCYGVGYKAYEVSKEGCEAYDGFLRSLQARAAEQLEELENDLVESFEYTERERFQDVRKQCGRDNPRKFKELRDRAIREVKGNQAHYGHERTRIAERIAAWVYQPDKIKIVKRGEEPRIEDRAKPDAVGRESANLMSSARHTLDSALANVGAADDEEIELRAMALDREEVEADRIDSKGGRGRGR